MIKINIMKNLANKLIHVLYLHLYALYMFISVILIFTFFFVILELFILFGRDLTS